MDIHKNAPLTPLGRADLVRRVVEDGQIPKAVAAAFGVSVAPGGPSRREKAEERSSATGEALDAAGGPSGRDPEGG